MYTINQNINSDSNEDYLEVINASRGSHAKIYLNSGASLQELTLKSHSIIKDMSPLTYRDTYASSILFPFANRVKDGKYEFDNNSYQLDINEQGLGNALHGLVYNKTFEILSQEASEDYGSISLMYEEVSTTLGFPYTYYIKLVYIFTESGLDLKIEIKNTSTKAFPFTVGWHPYFLSSNLQESNLDFSSDKKFVFDERNITTGAKDFEMNGNFEILNKFLDDCFELNYSKLTFHTPQYTLRLTSSEENSFLQLYTPPHKNTIAIEPTTGISDSFNNCIGLKILHPNEIYTITWSLKINDN